MFSSNVLASFALVISLCSLWISYIAFRQNSKRISAEKRTEAVQALRKISSQIRDLLRKVRQAEDSSFKRKFEEHYSELDSSINKQLSSVIRGEMPDAVTLELVKALAFDIGEIANDLSFDILDILENRKLATTKQIDQVKNALSNAIEASSKLIETVYEKKDAVSTKKLQGKSLAEIDAKKESIANSISEMTKELTDRVNKLLEYDEVTVDEIVMCNDVISNFIARANDIQFYWNILLATY